MRAKDVRQFSKPTFSQAQTVSSRTRLQTNFPLRAPYAASVGRDTVLPLADPITPWFSVKEAVLPFARFPGGHPVLEPEMRSTGEVMGWDRSFALAFLKAQIGAGVTLPESGRVFVSIKDMDKTAAFAAAAQDLVAMAF